MTLDRIRASLADRYIVERELGLGGMATVYLAHDIRHDRDVAIKVLHAELGAVLGGERFLSEIRTTARLQHPHILPLLDSGDADGLLYYVMPLVTGETLRSRLDRERQLPIDDAVRIASEVADALGYAHALGVIHRDIKPENILLQGGHAVVADFGIALAVQTAGGPRMTQTGLSLGTPQYMSPEQAMGERTIDARSDIYSLGAVTYEMLVGEAPFTGQSVQAIVARVMTEEPRGLAMQRKAIPERLEYAVMRALEKLPADRWASAHEFIDAVHDTSAFSGARGAASRYSNANRGKRRWSARLRDPMVIVAGAIAIASAALAGVAWWTTHTAAGAAGQVVSFTIPVVRGSISVLGFNTLSVSPDGRLLVYIGRSDGDRQMLLLRRIDDVTPIVLSGTEDANHPVFSPDGRSIAFVRSNQIYRTAVDGGSPTLLATVRGTFNGMGWSSTGVIVVSSNTELYLVPESGGAVRVLVQADKADSERYLDAPLVVDDAKLVLYASNASISPVSARIAVASMETGQTTVLNILGAQPLGIIDGVLVYVTSSGVVMGVPFDASKRRLTGAPVQLVTGVSINASSGLARAALSRTGTLFYEGATPKSQIVLASMRGLTRPLLDEQREFAFPRLSPDGKQLAVTVGSGGRRDIWLYDLASGTPTRLTSEGGINERPEWSPDGTRVLYRSDLDARSSILWRPADMSAGATPLLTGARIDVFEAVFSPDARFIAYQVDTAGADIYYHATNGDTMPRAVANNSKAIESMPRISPDGRWIAFDTDESGDNEVVVQPFPGPGGRVQVSVGGGTEPIWSRDGRRLFYRSRGQIMAATISNGPRFGVSSRDTLFQDVYVYATNPHANYDVTPDGTHLLFLKAASEGEMTVIVNWKNVLHARMADRPAP